MSKTIFFIMPPFDTLQYDHEKIVHAIPISDDDEIHL